MFTWLVYSFRPLTLSKLAEAISIEPHQREKDLDAVPTDPRDLLDFTGGLVIITGDNDTVGLSHFSVKEYLLSDRFSKSSISSYLQDTDSPHSLMVIACVTYLMMDEFAEEQLQTRIWRARFRTEFSLFKYAVKFWSEHYRAIPYQSAESVNAEIEEFLWDQEYLNQFRLMLQYDNYFRSFPAMPLPLITVDVAKLTIYHAAYFGLEPMLVRLLENGHDINAQGGEYGYPLLAAAFGRHEPWKVVEKLIDMGADIHVSCDEGNLAHVIARDGGSDNWNLLKSLIERKIELNGLGGKRAVLQDIAAHPSDSSTMVEYILDHGAGINMDRYKRSLSAACDQGNTQVVRVLLQGGANMQAELINHTPTLISAVRSGNRQIVDLLLQHGCDFNKRSGNHNTPFTLAVALGNPEIVRLLLANGADPNVGFTDSTLSAAIRNHRWDIVKMLIDTNADVNGYV